VRCAEEEEELRKALELSLQDIGKFESSMCHNLNPDAATAAAAASATDAEDEDSMTRFIDDDDDLLASNAFGVIKDIRVSNIVASDTDKMSQFDAKNFKQLMNHSDSAGGIAVLMSGTSEA